MKRKADWQHASLKEKLFKLMAMQEMAFRRRVRCPSVLQGRPMVFCVRFSSSVPDSVTDLAKEAIDKLCQDAIRKNPRTGNVTHIQRLGYLKDDSPRWVEIRQWTEKVPPGEGFVLIDILDRCTMNTCGKCMHFDRLFPDTANTVGTCEFVPLRPGRLATTKRMHESCPSFNAPSGFRWTYYGENRHNITHWYLLDEAEDEHVGHITKLAAGRWQARTALRWGSRELMTGTLVECARALIPKAPK